VTLTAAIDLYIDDMRAQARLNSDRSEESYRLCLVRHAEDVGDHDPRQTTREDVKRTLRRFGHPNTQRRQRSMLVSFYDWLTEEGLRMDNPARQTRAPKARKPQIYRLTLEEVRRFLAAAEGPRERRVAYLGVCAGLRRAELRLLQGRHLAREGWVWVSADIGKGGRERWVPVMTDLNPVAAEIRASTALGHYVLPARQFSDPGMHGGRRDHPERPCDRKTILRITQRIGRRAGIAAPVSPHMMRHAFADHVARLAGVRSAQIMLGHASIQTTEAYLGQPTLDELARAIAGVSFR
jgi:site-specific recombinase XerD